MAPCILVSSAAMSPFSADWTSITSSATWRTPSFVDGMLAQQQAELDGIEVVAVVGGTRKLG